MRVENDLKPHNVETIKQILEFYKTSNKCCAIQATGTGKTFLILRLLEIYNDMDKSAVIFAPNREIINQTKKRMKKFGLNNATFYTYQKLARMTDEEIENINADLIVCDELHRTGAKTWGQKFEVLVETHSDSKVFGVTATPLRCADGRDMSEEYFDGNKACDISLAEALVRKIIPVMPVYVSALYTFEEEYKNMSDKIENGRNTDEEKSELMKELKAAKQQLEKSNGIPEIIKKYITNYNGKYIVFCKDKKHLYAMKDVVIQWFRDAGYNGKIFDYPYYSNNNEVKRNLTNFENNEEDGLKLLFVIDKLNEGLHLDVIHGCILLRTTTSNIIYYQQIGRAIDAGCDQKRVILDLVSNFNSLKTFNLKEELNKKITERQNGKFSECSEDFDVDEFHVNDCIQECINIFNRIDTNILKNDWNEEDINYMEENYCWLGANNMSLQLHRSKSSVTTKAYEMNLKYTGFTHEQEDIIKENFEKYGAAYIRDEYMPDINYEKIREFATKILKLKPHNNRWDKRDTTFLVENYNKMSVDELAHKLNRTPSAIMTKANDLGLNKKNKWTEQMDNVLYKYYPNEGMEVYKRLEGVTGEQCMIRANKLGIKRKYNFVYYNKLVNKYYVQFTIDGQIISFKWYDTQGEADRVAMEKIKEYGKV